MKFQRKTKIILICVCILCFISLCLVTLRILPFIMYPITIFVMCIVSYYIFYKWLKWKNSLNKS